MSVSRLRLVPHRPSRLLSAQKYFARPLSSGNLQHSCEIAASEVYTPEIASTAANDEVAKMAAKPLHQLTLRDLVRFGRPPLPGPRLLASARFTRDNLPIRISRRILALRNLPFIVVSNPHISKIYNNYLHSLRTILSFPDSHPSTVAEEVKFTELLMEVVDTHANTIPILSKGFQECKRYINPAEVTKYLDAHLRARIGTRLMAEQHIALHLASNVTHSPDTPASKYLVNDAYIGTIDTTLRPAQIIESCASFVGDICELRYGVRPHLLMDGNTEVRFPYIPVHLEYIITELLKNAFRATIEAGSTRPVVVTIAAAPVGGGITIRIRDHGGGIPPEDMGNIWSYSYSTFNESTSCIGSGLHGGGAGRGGHDGDALGRFSESVGVIEGSTIAGLGYGLPLSRAYAEYFGGSLQVQSAYGWGTDVYLKLNGVSVEGI
ncbi:hypothetical protein RUND412_006740 [Rhizina undulata]